MLYFKLRAGTTFYYEPTTRTKMFPEQEVAFEVMPVTPDFRDKVRQGIIIRCEGPKEEAPVEAPKVEAPKVGPTRREKLLGMSRKEILKEFAWMEEGDLATASKHNKEKMLDYLLKIEPEYKED